MYLKHDNTNALRIKKSYKYRSEFGIQNDIPVLIKPRFNENGNEIEIDVLKAVLFTRLH